MTKTNKIFKGVFDLFGAIIGLAVILFFVGNGRLAGISGIVNNALVSKQNRKKQCLL